MTKQSAGFQGLEETCRCLTVLRNTPASDLKSVAPLTKESIGKRAHRCGGKNTVEHILIA